MNHSRTPLARGFWMAALTLTLASCGVKVHPYPVETTTDPGAGGSGEPVAPPPPGPGPVTPVPGAGGAGGGVSGAGGAGGMPATPGTGGDPGAGGAPVGGVGGTGSDAGPPPPGVDAQPPASNVGVTIGGRFVPKEKVIVFLHVGHSDMAGRATGPAALRPFMFDPHPQLWVYQKGGAFRAAREPTSGDKDSVNKSGPGMAILRTALMHAPDAQFISIGHGHSGSTIGWCTNFRRGKPLYGEFMDEARELKGKVTFGALFTMFGITEYHGGTQGLASVGDCILGLIKEVREDLAEPELPLMVGDWNQNGGGIYSPTGAEGRVVKPQLMALPMRDPRTGLIPTTGLEMEDDRHLNMAGQKLWAERAFMIMSDRGFMPWANM